MPLENSDYYNNLNMLRIVLAGGDSGQVNIMTQLGKSNLAQNSGKKNHSRNA